MSDRAITCRGCGKPILFVTTSHGKKMPVDPEKVQVMVKRKDEDVYYLARDAYVSHFATCEKADDFRKPRESHA